MSFILLCCLVLLSSCVLGANNRNSIRISSAHDLVKLSANVGHGTNFKGTTVFLDADIDFYGGLSEQFEPIGKDNETLFRGTFDGQGYMIKNLAMNSSSSQYVGLFGYTAGATIRNVVLDDSCSVVSSYSGSSWASAYAGELLQ